MIKQILYNCEADCTVLIRKPQVISGGGGAHPLHPPPRSALADQDQDQDFNKRHVRTIKHVLKQSDFGE